MKRNKLYIIVLCTILTFGPSAAWAQASDSFKDNGRSQIAVTKKKSNILEWVENIEPQIIDTNRGVRGWGAVKFERTWSYTEANDYCHSTLGPVLQFDPTQIRAECTMSTMLSKWDNGCPSCRSVWNSFMGDVTFHESKHETYNKNWFNNDYKAKRNGMKLITIQYTESNHDQKKKDMEEEIIATFNSLDKSRVDKHKELDTAEPGGNPIGQPGNCTCS